ncbi:MAG: hypothetical protein ACR2G5_11480 [Pyrinomonadaceae bacterium]
MKANNHRTAIVLGLAIACSPLSLFAGTSQPPQKKRTQVAVSAHQKKILAAFDRNVNDYLKQRERVKAQLPPLSKEATPEQIDAYQKAFVEALRAVRAGTKPGYIFNPEIADYFRTIIKTEFPPTEKAEIRQTILEADTKGVPLKVNYPYPEAKELTQIPTKVLLKFPQLAKEVKYRFVGRHLLLVDTDNNLIVDYMLNALP